MVPSAFTASDRYIVLISAFIIYHQSLFLLPIYSQTSTRNARVYAEPNSDAFNVRHLSKISDLVILGKCTGRDETIVDLTFKPN